MPDNRNLADENDNEHYFNAVSHLTRQLNAAVNILAEREQELLAAKGPCRNGRCRLHYAHGGLCDERRSVNREDNAQ